MCICACGVCAWICVVIPNAKVRLCLKIDLIEQTVIWIWSQIIFFSLSEVEVEFNIWVIFTYCAFLVCDSLVLWVLHFSSPPEYCEKYAKPEDAGAPPEDQSSDEELSEDEYDSSDEGVVGKPDP